MKKWNVRALILYFTLIGVSLLTMGCAETEESTVKVFSETKQTYALPSFIPAPERTKTEIDLPDSYNYIEENLMPVLRNQGDTNTCWAFASLSALEASKGVHSQNVYSADHLIHQNPFGRTFEAGGSYVVTVAYLLSWQGPVIEERDPYDGQSLELLTPDYHVQEIRQIEPKDYEAIKRFLYLYGAVESSLYIDFDEHMAESAYYNNEHNAYCYTGTEISNHDVVIVGWDDYYPAENFAGDIQRDGAFLCQNSWGEEFGDMGTFYVSYEDVNIGSYGVTYSRIESPDNYDHIYQSDLCGFTAQIGYQKEESWFANVYPAEEAISLRAAGFYATGSNTEYEIYVVSDFADKNSFKQRTFVCNGFLEDGGYYTIDFPKPIEIAAGKDFAVVVKINTENSEYPVAIECPVDGLSENADMTDGRGYLSLQGTVWEHVEETKKYNICLKAYADSQKLQ